MSTVHMVTNHPLRTPTFVPFADPNWFLTASGSPVCATPADCAFIPARTTQRFAWNHSDVQPEIAKTWLGYVGPGVDKQGISNVWSDHTDIRPTVMDLNRPPG
jgi:hypothetical protein